MSNKRPETKLVPVPSVNKIPERDVDKIKALWKDGWDQGLARLDEAEAFLKGV